MNYYLIALLSLGANTILLICLLSPNIVFFIHKKFFSWKVDKKCLNCGEKFTLVEQSKQDCDVCGRLLY